MKFIKLASSSKMTIIQIAIFCILFPSCNDESEQRRLKLLESRLRGSRIVAVSIIEGNDKDPRIINLSKGAAQVWQEQLENITAVEENSDFYKKNSRTVAGSIAVRLESGEVISILLMRGFGEFMPETEIDEYYGGMLLVPFEDGAQAFRFARSKNPKPRF
jgi:hypothetical protein